MYIKTTYDQEFDDLYMYLKAKYPDALFDIDGIGEQMDMSKFSRKFFASKVTADASIDDNSNVSSNSVIAYDIELSKPFKRLNSYYVLWKELRRLCGLVEANRIIEHNLCGDIYVHDMHGIGAGMSYCFNYSTYDLMMKGLCMASKVKSKPPKYLHSFKSQLEQFVIIASNSTLGATGLADLLVTMSYYVKNILDTKRDAHFSFATEEDCWTYVKEMLDSFIYSVNFDLRANQSPFTNVSVYDDNFLDKLCDDYIFPDGSSPEKDIIKKLQEIYLDIMNSELGRGVPITFPVTTACFSIDEENNILDEEFLEFISKKNMEFGFINIYCGKSSTLSSCCRLRSEQKSEYFNSFGSGSSKIGSLGVCSINFARLAFRHKDDEEGYFNDLKYFVDIAAKVNNAKRKLIEKRVKNGNEPLYTYGFMETSKQYSTCGVNAFYESITEMGYEITTQQGIDFALKIINTINAENAKCEKQYGAPHNCEQVPGEGLSVKFASKDKLLKYQSDYNLYSNQFIPLIATADLLDRIKIQGALDKYFSGGSILHLNCDTRIENYHDIMELIRATAKHGVIYHAINYVLQRCEDNHMSVGKNTICPICGKPITDNFTRVVGFLTNTKHWNATRRQHDFPNRKFYNAEQLVIKDENSRDSVYTEN